MKLATWIRRWNLGETLATIFHTLPQFGCMASNKRFFTCRCLQTFLVQKIQTNIQKKAVNVWENRTSQFTPLAVALTWESLSFPHMPKRLCLLPYNTVNSSLLHSLGKLMWNSRQHIIQYFATFMRKLEHLWLALHWACMLLWYF
jgi:hypothetical protein